MRQLASLGLLLNDRIKLDDLLVSHTREDYENRPFELLLRRMGGDVESPPWGRLMSDRVWYFDTECIESEGAYVAIVERLVMMSRADLRVHDLQDHVDFDEEEAWIRYRLDDEPRHFDAEVSDDWADTTAVTDVLRDLEDDGYRFARLEDGRQAMLLVYIEEDRLDELREVTGLDFEWASARAR